MNVSRHAAALALVGWYLMVPPTTQPSIGVDLNAPLSAWVILESFDTARECDAEQADSIKKASAVGNARHNANMIQRKQAALALSLQHAQCIATDDPRLAK